MTYSRKDMHFLLAMIATLVVVFLALAFCVPSEFARAEEPDRLVLQQVVTSTAAETSAGSHVYSSVEAGDTFTVRYRLTENDGMVDMILTPAYNSKAFELTSLSVDTAHWSLSDEYGYDDPTTSDYVPLTLEEFIAGYNAALAAGLDPYVDRLSFEIRFEGADAEGTTSDTFLTLVYTALTGASAFDASDPAFSFGLDVSTENALARTRALNDDQEQMTILWKESAEAEAVAVDAAMYTLCLEVSLSVVEDSTISFRYEEGEGYLLDFDSIPLIYDEPSFGAGKENPYLADGGEVQYLFFTRDPVTSDLQAIAAPTTAMPTDCYVKAVLSATRHFAGTESLPVPIVIEPVYVDLPELRLYVSGRDIPFTRGADGNIVVGELVYGASLTLVQVTDGEEVTVTDRAFYTYERKGLGEESFSESGDPCAELRPSVGDYRITIAAGTAPCVAFRHEPPLTAFTVTFTITPKQLTLNAKYNGGYVRFTCSGIVEDDQVGLSYFVDGVPRSNYTATEADYGRVDPIVATLVSASENYKGSSVQLHAVRRMTFLSSEGFEQATNMPEVQYVFEGAHAIRPEDPLFEKYAIAYWAFVDGAKEGKPYDFAVEQVEEDIRLRTVWEKVLYLFRFRALNASADRVTGSYRELAWNRELGTFEVANTSESFYFTIGTLLPEEVAIRGFRVDRWVKVIPRVGGGYDYIPVSRFERSMSVEEQEGVYYLAEMIQRYGKGDVNGNGEVTVEDVIEMKRYLVGASYRTIPDEITAWNAASGEAPSGAALYSALWDANGDGQSDTRDIVTLRDALVGGYGYTVRSDGVMQSVLVTVSDLTQLDQAVFDGEQAFLTEDILSQEAVERVIDGDVYVDLGGRTVSAPRLMLTVTGRITVRNGSIVANELYLMASDGVRFTDVRDGEGAEIIAEDLFIAAKDVDGLKAAVTAGRKVVLVEDVISTSEVTILAEGDVYLDLGGKTLSASILTLNAAGDVTILNGTVIAQAASMTSGGSIRITESSLIISELSLETEDGVYLENVVDSNESPIYEDGSQTVYEWQI